MFLCFFLLLFCYTWLPFPLRRHVHTHTHAHIQTQAHAHIDRCPQSGNFHPNIYPKTFPPYFSSREIPSKNSSMSGWASWSSIRDNLSVAIGLHLGFRLVSPLKIYTMLFLLIIAKNSLANPASSWQRTISSIQRLFDLSKNFHLFIFPVID